MDKEGVGPKEPDPLLPKGPGARDTHSLVEHRSGRVSSCHESSGAGFQDASGQTGRAAEEGRVDRGDRVWKGSDVPSLGSRSAFRSRVPERVRPRGHSTLGDSREPPGTSPGLPQHCTDKRENHRKTFPFS